MFLICFQKSLSELTLVISVLKVFKRPTQLYETTRTFLACSLTYKFLRFSYHGVVLCDMLDRVKVIEYGIMGSNIFF